MAADKDIADFEARLFEISELDGVPYKRAYLIFDEEERHKQSALQFQGYLHLSDAFKCFFLETVELINTHARPKIKGNLSEFYGIFVPRLAFNFKSLCATERVSTHGYPLQGYSLLRNTFDDIVLTSACLQKITDFYSIEGLVPGSNFDITSVKKLRKKTEFDVRQIMTGNKSGLKQETLDELAHWDALFDMEVHGGRLSLATSMRWMRGDATLPVLPRFDEKEFALFMNRYCEICWMLHRLIPSLQPPNVPFPAEWEEKWVVIDESFELMVNSLTEQLGKKIGAAIVDFVKTKFPFNAKSSFEL